ncbi:hypothetical protein WAI453_000887 [Rhynchosporium graminicola]
MTPIFAIGVVQNRSSSSTRSIMGHRQYPGTSFLGRLFQAYSIDDALARAIDIESETRKGPNVLDPVIHMWLRRLHNRYCRSTFFLVRL